MITTEPFGQLVRRYRRRAELTQETLAERAGLSVRAIRDIEVGSKHRPRRDTVQLLLGALDIPDEEQDSFLAAAGQGASSRLALCDLPGAQPSIRAEWEGRLTPHRLSLQQTPAGTETNVPNEPTPFIGRMREIAAITELLRRPLARLVTLTGTGGTGKTRLAMQVGRALLHEFPDGVFFVSLAPISNPELVPSTIAIALALGEVDAQLPMATLETSINEKQALLILDNFEHLLPAAAMVADLLEACPQLHILVTSRRPLHLVREHEFAVLPLEVPDGSHATDVRGLTAYDAVALFVQRAQTVKADFALTSENAQSVVDICRRVDGLPLAIELAAIRIKLFTPQALLARMEHRMPMLTGGAHDLPPRQQTMRSTVAWSYDLLTPPEQTLFRCLSVFIGGCAEEEAEAVCRGLFHGEIDVLPGLESLLNGSLLFVTERENGEPRFHMLETIREYALEHLQSSGEEEVVRRLHAETYLQLAECAEQILATGVDSASLRPFGREYENLSAALRWSLQREGTNDLTVRLAGALSRFWITRRYQSGAQRWIERVVPLCKSRQLVEDYPGACARVFSAATCIALWSGDIAMARSYGERSMDLWSVCHDTRGLSFIMEPMAHVAWLQGDRALEGWLLEERVRLSRESGESGERISALQQLGARELRQGNFGASRSLFEEALGLAQMSGSARTLIDVRSSLAVLACCQNDMAAARKFHDAALAQARAVFDPVSDTMDLHAELTHAAFRAIRMGDYEDAVLLREEKLSLARLGPDTVENRLQAATALNTLGDGMRCVGNIVGATAAYEESLALFRKQGDRLGIAWVLHNLGHIALSEGDARRGRALFEEGLTVFRELKYSWSIIDCLAGLAAVVRQEGYPERSALLFGAAEAAHEALDASGWLIDPANKLACEREIAAARSAIDAETWDRAWASGRAMSVDAALALAEPAKSAAE